MKRIFILFLTLIISFQLVQAGGKNFEDAVDSTWMAFRQNNPFCLQTVALRHLGDDCIFIISEPSESVSKDAIGNLFKRYGGVTTVKQKEFGYDGWLADVVGKVRFTNEAQQQEFKKELFNLLYGTDYKAYYSDLDNPVPHVFYSNYNLNYSITPNDLTEWFVVNGEQLKDVTGTKHTIKTWLSTRMAESNKLLYSENGGFVVWLIDAQRIKTDDILFKTNARRFAIDADLIIGAMGRKGNLFAVIARERQIPFSVMPPLRTETLELLAKCTDKNLAQSYERYNVFAGKLPDGKDVAPIYLSDELWHTEYGNLLNVTDQMLKSWSENGMIEYDNFNYPKPIDWAFAKGAIKDLGSSSLTYNWNTKGAGYIVEDDYDIYAINRTGSLPVSYFPDELEGHMDSSVYDAEELAYDFFSQLGNPDLARVVQYAAFYQIVTYFKSDVSPKSVKKVTEPSVPDYSVFYEYIEKLLRIAGQSDDVYETKEYRDGLARFEKRSFDKNNVALFLDSLITNDPYGEFESYLQKTLGVQGYEDFRSNSDSDRSDSLYRQYLDTNISITKQYIDSYKSKYGSFPYSEAAQYIVSPREISAKYNEIVSRRSKIRHDFDSLVVVYYSNLKDLDKASYALYKDINLIGSFLNANEPIQSYSESDDIEVIYNRVFDRLKKISAKSNIVYKTRINELIDQWNSNEKIMSAIVDMQPIIEVKTVPLDSELIRLSDLQPDSKCQRAIGALNWLLTDAGPFDIPSGQFFASKLTTHRQWAKSPSMCSSSCGDGSYGGHNLDAHITPLRKAVNVPQGKCRVSFENGNRVVSASKEDMKRITPQVLRKIERQVINDGELVDLPPIIPPKSKSSLMEINYLSKSIPHSIKKQNVDIRSVDDLMRYKSQNPGVHETVRISRYNEREALVEVDGQQYILERSGTSAVDGNSLDGSIKVEARGDKSAVVLYQKKGSLENTSIRAANVEFICDPELAPEVSKSLQSMIGTPSLDLNNTFKTIRNLKLDLQNRKVNFSGDDIKMEEVIFSHIIIMFNEENGYYESDISRVA